MQQSQYSNDSYFPSILFNPDYQQEYYEPESEVENSSQWVLNYGLLSPPFDVATSQVCLPSTSTSVDDNFLPYPSYHSSNSSIDSSYNTFALPPLQQQSTSSLQQNHSFSDCAPINDSDYYIPRIFATLPTPLPSPTLSCHSSIYPSEAPEYYDFAMENKMEMDSPSEAMHQQLSYESQYLPQQQQQQHYQQQQESHRPQESKYHQQTPQQQQYRQQQQQSQVVEYHQEEQQDVTPASSTSSMIQTPSPQREEHITFVDLPRSNPSGAEGSCTPFVSKLAYLLRNPDLYQDIILWDKFGKTFIIAPSPKMIDEVLPNIFLHSSLAAFTRQLNTYGFRRLNREALTSTFSHSPDSSTPIKELSAWAHPNFQKNSPSLLNLLTPRPSRARELHRKGKLLLAESTFGMAGTSHVVLKNAFNRVKLVKKDKSYKS